MVTRLALMLKLGAFAAGVQAADIAPSPTQTAQSPNAACLECHSDTTLTMLRGGRNLSLFFDEAAAGKSVHKSLDCADCHDGYDGNSTPHRKTPVAVDCLSCHERTGAKHSFHRRLVLNPIPEGKDTACTECHGKHEVVATKATPFHTSVKDRVVACGVCHEKEREQFDQSAHGLAVQNNTPSAPDCLSCHRTSVVARAGTAAPLELKLIQTKQCESCHVKDAAVASQSLRGSHFAALFERSVHGAALSRGKAEAANCVDCHGAHEMNRAMVPGARLNKRHVAKTCSQCHQKSGHEFGESVHAAALAKGNVDSATCTDCHGEHDIREHADPASPVHKANVAQQVCADCHASLKLTKKYGIASHTFSTFSDSYHGLAVRGGSVEVVNCASCHRSHAIKSHLDPTSSVHKDNLASTCGQCHPGANARFTVGQVHVSAEAKGEEKGNHPLLYLIQTIYVFLIVGIVGAMAVHNGLDFVKKIRRKLAIQKGIIAEEHVAHRLYLRMTLHERLQHAALVISFVLLVVTGFMLRYPEAWWVAAIRDLSVRTFEWRGWLHRGGGIAMILAGLWHGLYLAFSRPGRSLLSDLLPRWRDLTDPWQVLRYNLGLAATKPAFPRFSYIEKLEYWALVWGTFLMTVTGIVLWFENASMGYLTKLGYDIARTIHFYEAILATLAIVVWHFYFVIFNPDVYPMNLAWLTGRMSEKEMLEEHPLELERLKKSSPAADAVNPEQKRSD